VRFVPVSQACSDTTIISCFYVIMLNYCSQLVITISALVPSELNYVLVHFSNISGGDLSSDHL
jgi:hypothetical protein